PGPITHQVRGHSSSPMSFLHTHTHTHARTHTHTTTHAHTTTHNHTHTHTTTHIWSSLTLCSLEGEMNESNEKEFNNNKRLHASPQLSQQQHEGGGLQGIHIRLQ